MNFCTDFFGHVGKRLDKKAKLNFKVHDVTDWIKTMTIGVLLDISKRKKSAENETERLVPDPFLFFKKALHEEKASGQHFSLDIIW